MEYRPPQPWELCSHVAREPLLGSPPEPILDPLLFQGVPIVAQPQDAYSILKDTYI